MFNNFGIRKSSPFGGGGSSDVYEKVLEKGFSFLVIEVLKTVNNRSVI